MVLGPRGVAITALNGLTRPFSTKTRILDGVLSGPFHSSISASSGRPSVPISTRTCSTAGDGYDQVRSEPPCTRIVGLRDATLRPDKRPRVDAATPMYPCAPAGT
eukprot:scaffold48919_cov33-Tisochrysis_lutea.AAC.2